MTDKPIIFGKAWDEIFPDLDYVAYQKMSMQERVDWAIINGKVRPSHEWHVNNHGSMGVS
ncbi:hypothetical protein E6Q11_01105 [Candidatus Dojkabacteria bacterium]|uniref:Uncharacterized protein n=1 Tax=Candidatus Dojkabacteria bacterium TaxID=2099670 RepID=A0A5C7JCZ5_9BACT|nr:MAG: hypothetical protein E6Q11_01105 [Candidatus Dojkabacteria bacterium]